MNILLTGVTGMFGNAVLQALCEQNSGVLIKVIVRNLDKVNTYGFDRLQNVEVIVADLLQPKTLKSAFNGVDRAFLVTPMVKSLDQMEFNFINVAKNSNVKKLYKLYGAVEHKKDDLIKLHTNSINYLQQSGLAWTLISPNSVMETCLMPLAQSIKQESSIYGCTGHHKVGMVALQDVARATAILMTSEHPDYQNYKLTGPQSLSYYDLAKIFSNVLNKNIKYQDYSEDEFADLLQITIGKSTAEIEMEYMCHFRAWNQNGADFITNTYTYITNYAPTAVEDWLQTRKELFL